MKSIYNNSGNEFNIYLFEGIDGQEDMKPIYGTIVAGRKAKQGKAGKVKKLKKHAIFHCSTFFC